MVIAVVDCRRYGKQRKHYVLKQDANNDAFPSLANWREVRQDDFASETLVAYLSRLQRSK